MMGHRQIEQAALFYEFSLERHVPTDHLLRSIDRFVELGGLRRAGDILQQPRSAIGWCRPRARIRVRRGVTSWPSWLRRAPVYPEPTMTRTVMKKRLRRVRL